MGGERIEVVPAIRLQSNQIRLRLGGDKTEPREVTQWATPLLAKGLVRYSVAINTYYPELEGAYYKNVALVRLVLESIRELHCSLVWKEVISRSKACPDEIDGAIDEGELYGIVKDEALVGELISWHFNAGGGSQFLRDAVILDFASPAELAKDLFDRLEESCEKNGVPCSRWSTDAQLLG